MNIYDLDDRQVGELWDEHLDAMAEAKYDDYQSDGNPHIKVVTKEEIQQINEDLPF